MTVERRAGLLVAVSEGMQRWRSRDPTNCSVILEAPALRNM